MKKISLCVVDDYLLTRIAHKQYFKSDNDFNYLGDFSSAEDCLKILGKKEADIILMDIELPKMNGIEATKIIKEKYPDTKIIILTSYKNEQRALASIACGASAYILKNNSNLELKKIINLVIQGEFVMDNDMAESAFSLVPIPNTKDLENLYENRKLKNSLTTRELEVLRLIIDGKTNSEIASEIIVSINTAKAHVGSILNKFSVTDRVQAAVKAVRANIF